MFKPLSDALALVLALTLAEPDAERPRIDAAHEAMQTRWGQLAVRPAENTEAQAEVLTFNGRVIEGFRAGNLWIVGVEAVSEEMDRVMIAAAEPNQPVPTQFNALTVTPKGAALERGGIVLKLGAAAASVR
jgi:hypothetical protein